MNEFLIFCFAFLAIRVQKVGARQQSSGPPGHSCGYDKLCDVCGVCAISCVLCFSFIVVAYKRLAK